MSRRRRTTALASLAVLALMVLGAVLWSGVVGDRATPAAGTAPPVADSAGADGSRATQATPVPTPSPEARPTRTPTPAPVSGEITVLAASSLADAFAVLADGFEAANPGVTVTLGLGPSSGLAAQVASGAPADILATASESTMEIALDGLRTAGVVGADDVEPVVFAQNTLAIAVPTANPGDVSSIDDLTRDDVTFAMCQAQVPCGSVARHVLAAAGIDRDPVTFEQDVGGVLTKVVLGEVDAGLVYASDVRATSLAVLEGTIEGIEIPERLNTTTRYPIVLLPAARQDRVAQAFLEHVLSPRGAQVLRDAGFLAP